MKKITSIFSILLFVVLFAQAQSPTVYCTFWNGSVEYLAHVNFNTNTVDTIGKIPGSTVFPVVQDNGYDPYRNRYYTFSNQGLVAVDATSGQPVQTAPQYAGSYKHLSYNPVSDLLYATRFNGLAEEYYEISPVTLNIVNQGILNLGSQYFVAGFFSVDAFANEVIFRVPSVDGIKIVNMTTGAVTRSISSPANLGNILLATHDAESDLYYAIGFQNATSRLVQINKSTGQISDIGIIPGVSAIAISGSAIDPITRKFVFVSNLGVTAVSLNDPTNINTIPFPAGARNVKGFQANNFSAPVTRTQGRFVMAQFKFVDTWLKDGVEIPNSATSQFAPTESGNYSYKVRRQDGTVTQSLPVTFSITSTPNVVVKESIRFHIDPVQEKLVFQLPEPTPIHVSVYNASGHKVSTAMTHNQSMDVHQLAAGVYQFVIAQGNAIFRGRLLKP